MYNCLTGDFKLVTVRPFIIGSGGRADLRVPGKGNVFPEHCELIVPENGETLVKSVFPNINFKVNGNEASVCNLELRANYLVQLGDSFLLIRGDSNLDKWRDPFLADSWEVVNHSGEKMLPMDRHDLANWAKADPNALETWVVPAGLSGTDAMVPLNDVTTTVEELAPEVADEEPPPDDEIREVADAGKHLCPRCLQRFDDAYWVATHEELRPDPILKGDSFLRFLPAPNNFRADGTVKDALGSICRDIACPHDRLVLPHGFLQTRNHIVSIVGDTQSGKTYYLSVMSKKLPETLIKNFGVSFTDMDPRGNVLVNDMANTLFSRSGPEQASLLKTTLDGFMYEDVYRKGRTVKMPRPFIYSLSHDQLDEAESLTFYDNAGEHFQPGADTEDRPGAQHVGAAEGIIFMFDPFNSVEFRQRMADYCKDPQMGQPIKDMHRTMLDEIGVRIRRYQNTPPGGRVQTSLAIVVGKFDGWKDAFPGCSFDDPMEQSLYSCRLPYGEWVIGREGTGHIDLPFASVSRPHARIIIKDEMVQIVDLGSANGTFVDGNRLEPNVPVNVHPFSKVRLYDLLIDLSHSPISSQPEHPYVMTVFKELKALNSLQLQDNSDRMRAILVETCPGLVASAEKLSQNVRYFPISTFGHMPAKVEIDDEGVESNPMKKGAGSLNVSLEDDASGVIDGGGKNTVWKIAPDPRKLRPFQVDIPVLWILSRIIPNIIPEVHPEQEVLNPD